MEHDFWHQKWERNQIGFHLAEVNPLLVKHFSRLSLQKQRRVFLPLCGKTLDIAWLLTQGYQMVGAELSELAIQALFEQLNLKPKVIQLEGLKLYQAEAIDIFAGDIFALDSAELGHVDAIYDRAAFVALPDEMRIRYSQYLRQVTHSAPQLLITFEYDQTLHAGPPFSINEHMVRQHYADFYNIQLLASEAMPEGLKGQYPATEQVWLLKP